MTDAAIGLTGFDCAVLVETIEHLEPRSSVAPRALPVSRDASGDGGDHHAEPPSSNPLLGFPPHRFRHPDHRFEWDRAQFRKWCERAAGGAGYRVTLHGYRGGVGAIPSSAVRARWPSSRGRTPRPPPTWREKPPESDPPGVFGREPPPGGSDAHKAVPRERDETRFRRPPAV